MALKYLIVDDEPLAHKIIEKFGADVPHLTKVGNCYDAIEAMGVLQQEDVDLIFLDIKMPKLKGLDFLRSLSRPPSVILTTAYKEYALEGYELNVVDYLLKPFSFNRFFQAVSKVVDKRSMTKHVVDWVVERQVRIKMLVKRVLKSPVYHRFVEGAPGLTEIAILGHAMRAAKGALRQAADFDVVVLDAPATGHGVYLLTAPRLFAETIGEGPFADLAAEVATYVADPAACGLVVVTLAEEMPVQEALELRRALAERFGSEPELLVANGLYPALPPDAPEAGDDELTALWRQRHELNRRELARLEKAWDGPRIDLPLLPIDRGSDLVTALTARFDAALDTGVGSR